jgi:hypothetical protein
MMVRLWQTAAWRSWCRTKKEKEGEDTTPLYDGMGMGDRHVWAGRLAAAQLPDNWEGAACRFENQKQPVCKGALPKEGWTRPQKAR